MSFIDKVLKILESEKLIYEIVYTASIKSEAQICFTPFWVILKWKVLYTKNVHEYYKNFSIKLSSTKLTTGCA